MRNAMATNPKWTASREILLDCYSAKAGNAPFRLYKMSLASIKSEVILTNAGEGLFVVQQVKKLWRT